MGDEREESIRGGQTPDLEGRNPGSKETGSTCSRRPGSGSGVFC